MDTEHIRNAISHSSIQDSLLQSYRIISLSLQSVLIGIGLFLLTKVLDKNCIQDIAFPGGFLLVLFVFTLCVGIKLTRIIIHRGGDVSFWHKQIILLEQELPADKRLFTKFKASQRLKRRGDGYIIEIFDLPEQKLTDSEIDEIIEKGLEHTRRFLDKYIPRSIWSAWIIIILIAASYAIVLAMR